MPVTVDTSCTHRQTLVSFQHRPDTETSLEYDFFFSDSFSYSGLTHPGMKILWYHPASTPPDAFKLLEERSWEVGATGQRRQADRSSTWTEWRQIVRSGQQRHNGASRWKQIQAGPQDWQRLVWRHFPWCAPSSPVFFERCPSNLQHAQHSRACCTLRTAGRDAHSTRTNCPLPSSP